MKPTTAQRTAALVAFINAEDIRHGRPADIADRTADRGDLNIRLKPSKGVGSDGFNQILVADTDNNTMESPFAVLTMDEAATTLLIPDRVGLGLPDYSEADCVTIDGVTFLVVLLG